MSDSTGPVPALVEGMKESIAAHRRGRLSLDRLVSELKGRIVAVGEVEGPDRAARSEWADRLRSVWWDLEEVNAFWIDGGRRELETAERAQVERALDELLSELTTMTLKDMRDEEFRA